MPYSFKPRKASSHLLDLREALTWGERMPERKPAKPAGTLPQPARHLTDLRQPAEKKVKFYESLPLMLSATPTLAQRLRRTNLNLPTLTPDLKRALVIGLIAAISLGFIAAAIRMNRTASPTNTLPAVSLDSGADSLALKLGGSLMGWPLFGLRSNGGFFESMAPYRELPDRANLSQPLNSNTNTTPPPGSSTIQTIITSPTSGSTSTQTSPSTSLPTLSTEPAPSHTLISPVAPPSSPLQISPLPPPPPVSPLPISPSPINQTLDNTLNGDLGL